MMIADKVSIYFFLLVTLVNAKNFQVRTEGEEECVQVCLEESKDDCLCLPKEVADLHKEIDSFSKTYAMEFLKEKLKNRNLQDALDKKKAGNENLKGQLDEAQAQLVRAETENKQLNEQLEQVKGEKATLQDENKHLKDENKDLNIKLQEEKEKVDLLMAQMEELKKIAEDALIAIDAIKTELKETKEQLEQVKGEKATLQETVEKLTKELKDSKLKAAAEIEELNIKLQEEKEKVDLLMAQMEELKKIAENALIAIDAFKTELKETKEKLETCQGEKDQLTKALEVEKEKVRLAMEAFETLNETCTKEIDHLQGEIAKLKKELEKCVITPPPCVTIPPGYQNFSGKYIRYFNRRKTWHKARDACKADGGDLISVRNSATNEWLAKRSYLIWIGANDQKKEGDWVWPNGDPVKKSRWAFDQPDSAFGNEDCALTNVGLFEHGVWGDVKCDDLQRYACEIVQPLCAGN